MSSFDGNPYSFRILSIDPGSYECGVTVTDYTLGEPPRIRCCITIYAKDLTRMNKLWDHEVRGDKFTRIKYMAERITNIAKMYRPDIVISEDCHYQRGKILAFRALTEFISVVRDALFVEFPNLNFILIDARSVKHAVNVSGKGKELMKVALKKQDVIWDTGIKFRDLSEHAIDSACVMIYLIRAIGDYKAV